MAFHDSGEKMPASALHPKKRRTRKDIEHHQGAKGLTQWDRRPAETTTKGCSVLRI